MQPSVPTRAGLPPKGSKHRALGFDYLTEAQMHLHLHHRWAQATTALQISIAFAAIGLLAKRGWLEWGVFGVAGIGVALGAAALLHA